MHLILLGDSTLDNKSYTRGGLAVEDHIEAQLEEDSAVTLLAEDGDVTSGIVRQLRHLPSSATQLVLSVGGNDALGHDSVHAWPVGDPAVRTNHLAGATGDAINAILVAAGHNMRLLIAWLAALWHALITALFLVTQPARIATCSSLSACRRCDVTSSTL